MPAAAASSRPRTHADAEDDEVGVDRAVAGDDGLGLEPLDRRAAPHVDAVVAQRVADAGAEVGVDDGERLLGLLDDRRRAAALDVGLGHLQPDVAAADDDDPPAAVVGQGQQGLGVGEALHAADERQVDAGEVGAHRGAAGGDQQLVEADTADRAGVLVEELDLAGVEVDARGVVVDAHVDAAPPVLLGRAGHERLDATGDQAADDERDPARRVAREPRPFEHDDLAVRPGALDAGGGRHAGGVTPDDHRAERHRPVLAPVRRAPVRRGRRKR